VSVVLVDNISDCKPLSSVQSCANNIAIFPTCVQVNKSVIVISSIAIWSL